jgi:hypothetical protein
MREKKRLKLKRLTRLRVLAAGLKPGGNDTFSHSSPGKFEIDIRRRSCHKSSRVHWGSKANLNRKTL